MAGRPTKYTPEAVAKIVDAIRMGATYDLAASYAGVHPDTMAKWRKAKADFSERILEAEGAGAVACLARIQNEAKNGEWRAAAWILEHRHPHQYGKTVGEISGPDGSPITINVIERPDGPA